ncbi:MAG TPA: hypothetical protein VG944_21195 [Fimbriimonas sp.]|nr:hypothetical protein [Fimbriimonas sp.]
MGLIEFLQSSTLDSFLAAHPEIREIVARNPATLPERINDPLGLLVAESAYNEKAMSYVCAVGGTVGMESPYANRFLVQSQVMAAFSVEEGGFVQRGFLDPHSSLREFMLATVSRILGRTPPRVPFAEQACERMGQVYRWEGDVPEVPDRHAAMLGAHFASEYLAAQQEFPGLVQLFQRDQPKLMEALRAEKESHFGFTAIAWLEGHPIVELKHAGFAGRAAEAAAWQLEDPAPFWSSFFAGFEEFCRNDATYFTNLADSQRNLTAVSG